MLHSLRSAALPCAALAALLCVDRAAAQKANVVYHDPALAWPGLNLEIYEEVGNRVVRAFDMDGNVAHTWSDPNNFWYIHSLAKPLAQGNLLGIIEIYPGSPSLIAQFNSASRPVWAWDMSPWGFVFHHDFERVANGNTLGITRVTWTVPSIRQLPLADELVVEVDPVGNYVWAWSTALNWAQIPFTIEFRTYVRSTQNGVVFHANSMQSLPPNRLEATDPRFRAGNVLLSLRNANLVFIIEKSTGNIVWSYSGGIGQHHLRMIPQGLPGAGNILMFDNGGSSGRPIVTRNYSRVVELDPVTQKEVWAYECPVPGGCSRVDPSAIFYSQFMSSAQRLPNGNTLIAEDDGSRAFEVTSGGAIVWEYQKNAGRVFRTYRVDPSWLNSATLAPFHW